MFRPSAVLAASLLSLALLTACSDNPKDTPDQARPPAASSSPTPHEPEEALEEQDRIPDDWPPEIPLPVGYKIEALVPSQAPDSPIAHVSGLPEEAVSATLADFESNGFTLKEDPVMNKHGSFDYSNEKWEVKLIVFPQDANGEPTTEDTGAYSLDYVVSLAE